MNTQNARSPLLDVVELADILPPAHISKSKFPRITIITPSFNQGAFLEQCIDSILSQNYPNLEYMILDGGSTDNSISIIKKYEKHLAYWRSAPDGGHYAAVNEGLQRATGEIMGWLNSDDMFHLKGLYVISEVFNGRPDVELITGKRIGFGADGDRRCFEPVTQRWTRAMLLDKENFIDPRFFICLMQESTYWRRSLWQRAGGTLDLSRKLAADFELWMRFSRHAKIHTVNECIAGFRDHGATQRSVAHRGEYLRECETIVDAELLRSDARASKDEMPPPLIKLPLAAASSVPVVRPAKQFDESAYVFVPNVQFPKITIVTPSYNQGHYLEECIDSVLSQRWANLEYIIMDGGSTDNSVEIIKRHEKYLSYWQSKPDDGHYTAVNEGFKRSSGQIMAWLNADDKYHPNALNLVAVSFQQRPEAEWIVGRPNGYNEAGDLTWILMFIPMYRRELYLRKQYQDPWIQQESVFWKRSLWDRAGGTLDTSLHLAADLELWTRFFRHAQLHSVNFLLGGFRHQENQRSQLHFLKYEREVYTVLDREADLLKQGIHTQMMPAPTPLLEFK